MGQTRILRVMFKRRGMLSRHPAKPVPRNGKEERGRGEVIYFSSFEPTSTKYLDKGLGFMVEGLGIT